MDLDKFLKTIKMCSWFFRCKETKPQNEEIVEIDVINEYDESFELTPNSIIVLNGSLERNFDASGKDSTNIKKVIYYQISKQITSMLKANFTNDERQDKMSCRHSDGKSLNVSIVQIAKDGNCLFSSLSHQLFMNKVNSVEHRASSEKLRHDIVQWILNNYNDSENELRCHVLELKDSHDGGYTNLKQHVSFLRK